MIILYIRVSQNLLFSEIAMETSEATPVLNGPIATRKLSFKKTVSSNSLYIIEEAITM